MKLIMPIKEHAIETTDIRATADRFVNEAKRQIESGGVWWFTLYSVQAHKVIAVHPPIRNEAEKDLSVGLAMKVAVDNPDTLAVICLADFTLDGGEALAACISVRGQEPLVILNAYSRQGKKITWEKEEVHHGSTGRLVAQFPETTSH